MHVLILANGEMPSRGLLARLREEADLFLAADGAANALDALGFAPDVVLGDFDSLLPGVSDRLAQAAFVPARDQEASDLDKAIAYAREHGARRITLTGTGGGRMDHTLTHISLLLKYHGELEVRVVEDWGEMRVVTDAAEFHGAPGDTLSLIVFAPVEGVTVEGVRWPLRDETLHPGSRGVSNALVEWTARVSVRSGVLIVCHLRTGEDSPE